MRPHHRTWVPLGILATLFLVPVVAAFTDSTLESKVRRQFGLPHPCIPRTADSPGWSEEPSLPGRLDEPRAVTVDGKIYLAGGITEIVFPDQESRDPGADAKVPIRSARAFRSYDPGTGDYENLPPMPEGLNHIGLAVHDRNIYVMGGHGRFLAGGDVRRNFFRYTVAGRRWERLSPMPTARGASGVAVLGDKLYVAGGLDAARPPGKPLGTATDAVEVFDFDRGRWAQAAPMSRPREHVAAAEFDGHLYVFGGRDRKDDALSDAERYDPKRDRWDPVAPLQIPTGGGAAVTAGGGIFVMGGGDDRASKVTDAVQRYDPASGSWSQRPPMRTPRHGFAATNVGRTIFTFGGSPCAKFAASDTAESFDSEVEE